MLVIIEDNYNLYKYNLNKDIEYKSIKIYQNNKQFFISLKDKFYFDDNQKIKKLEKRHYTINIENIYYQISIYVYPDTKGIDEYALYATSNILISSKDRSHIKTLDPYLKDKYLMIKDGIISSNFKVSVNNSQYNKLPLKQNDIIDFLGLRIIYFDKFLYINKFLCDIKIPRFTPNENIIKYKYLYTYNNYYITKTIEDLNIVELKKYEKPRNNTNNELYKNIMPNLMTLISISSLSFINYYNASIQGRDLFQKVSYLIMPVSMLFTTFLLPILFNLIDKHNHKKEVNKSIDDYLVYLDEYTKKLDESIKQFLISYNSHYFSLLEAKEKMFYATRNSKDYLTISLGKIKIEKQFDCDLTEFEIINKRLEDIRYKLSNIDDVPLLLDLKKYNIITIISKKSQKKNIFYKYILEICFKHHYEDINIAIYSKDLSIINELYNLPHMFIDNKRMSLNSYNDLHELDQRRLDKPLVLFMYDLSQYRFTNKNIYVVYFSDNRKELYKDFKAIVEYGQNGGTLYTDQIIKYTYYQEDIRFLDYFNELGKYNVINNDNSNYGFNSIYKDYDIENNYLSNNKGLKSIFAYKNKELISLDLHESKQGPHGLIGGSTGSGKSELIVSLLLSMCIRYSPKYLNIVLIDYKGGGIYDSLSYNNQSIPHICAYVSNLENNVFERLIIALNNECIERQRLFKQLSNKTNQSIMNIDDFRQNNTFNLRNISHLLIVVDEFAQLRKENPELIKELISISRIGRSLGIHLILATQKPSGNIDDEIWSNSRFKIALKVFEEKDSIDIIKIKDAAYIKDPGAFLIRVDESVIDGKAFYSKKDINENEPYEVSILNNTLESINEYKLTNIKIVSEASYYCKKIIDTCKKLEYERNTIDFIPPISTSRKKLSKSRCFIFGEIDDYHNCKKDLLAYDLKDNLLIYSERRNEINSILNTLNEFKRQTIVIGNIEYNNSYISDSILFDQIEDIDYLFNKIDKDNLDICLIIEDLNVFLTYSDKHLNDLYSLIKRSERQNYNIICLTNSSQLSFKINNAFKNKIMINNSDTNNISSFFMSSSEYKGNSFFFKEKPISFIPIIQEKLAIEERIVENIISRIPEIIGLEILSNKCLVGYDVSSREKVFVDKNTLITSLDEDLLNRYKSYSNHLTIHKYNHSLINRDFKSIVWLGPGIFSQRLFISKKRNDLNSNEGLYINEGKEIVIKVINDV